MRGELDPGCVLCTGGLPASWVLSYTDGDPAGEGTRETMLTLGNGYLAARGAAPEAVADGIHYPGTYLAGFHNRQPGPDGGEESIVNLPNWLPLTFRPAAGHWYAPEHGRLPARTPGTGPAVRAVPARTPAARPGGTAYPDPAAASGLDGCTAPRRIGDHPRRGELVGPVGDPFRHRRRRAEREQPRRGRHVPPAPDRDRFRRRRSRRHLVDGDDDRGGTPGGGGRPDDAHRRSGGQPPPGGRRGGRRPGRHTRRERRRATGGGEDRRGLLVPGRRGRRTARRGPGRGPPGRFVHPAARRAHRRVAGPLGAVPAGRR